MTQITTAKKSKRAMRGLEADRCYHWCTLGRHDWSHTVQNQGMALDQWKKTCQNCRRAHRKAVL